MIGVDPALIRQKCFQPPYCPHTSCENHLLQKKGGDSAARGKFFSKGWVKTKNPPFRVRLFQCQSCKKVFRYTIFKLSYREKKPGLNAKIFRYFTCGVSNREIARQLRCSENLVRHRLKKLSQWALMRHAEFLNSLSIDEPIVFDGLENFAKSQYNPNNINQAIGAQSLFIYDFNFAPLNRKGRMSPRQKIIRKDLESHLGRYHPRAIRTSSAEIFKRLYEKRFDPRKPLVIYSDEHFQYQRAIRWDLEGHNIQSVQISSKDYRNYKNLLFPVNHADLLIRQHVGAFSRETICFSKTHERMVQKYVLFLTWKNYFRTQFVKPHRRDPETNQSTPAMRLGLTAKPLEFHEFFDIKRTHKHVQLNREWTAFYNETPTYTRMLTLAA